MSPTFTATEAGEHRITADLSASPSEAAVDAVALQADIPLDPGHGGRSIPPDALEPGDVIFSTTNERISAVIRRVSGPGPVSHARIYIGKVANEPMVVEAVSSGVQKAFLGEIIKKDNLAVAFRMRGMTSAQRSNLMNFLESELDKPYDHWGVIGYPFKRFVYKDKPASVNFENTNPKGYFCSQLVEEAFKRTGMPIFTTTAYPPSPNDLASLTFIPDKIEYVGHLKTP
ncbi:YiiX/YebB-like N1pC/P60 family cysteine hydrolase [Hymenobacter sp. YC55]|uniref:YiiX/YebB-like N1pC/P60 family cysteine hydrolase n=1 Tax=Hymenobacter sp. YC55 TaxID=3034019 RepID=UPI0023F7B5B7|nr:YiiX/YebB-like N1pC/P60 family cysteine hydrolase [Hymenobacter sp. YC55]MDF7815730.1 YiiX/YebB-like N1pC/P60 family cysteine hydrolase [Hymenobacter sp. YC55]